jgi:hypothetical protein
MWTDNSSGVWSAAGFALIENALWQENRKSPVDLTWLQQSWEDPTRFGFALHAYWQRRQASPSKSTPWTSYDFYHDVLVRQKDQSASALIWFEHDSWHSWSYAELGQAVNSLVATWETVGVQPGETLAILYPEGPLWLMALLAGLRLGLVVTLLPPQGNAFVSRRLDNVDPQWLAMDPLYKHQLADVWYERVLPSTLSSVLPSRRSYQYSGTSIVVQCFDPTSATPHVACPVDADSFYLNAIRDGILALGIQSGQRCAAPGWHGLESQPALILAVLLCGGAWVHINFSDLKKQPERLLEQAIDVLGVSRSLRDLLLEQPSLTEKSWRYWFRHPAESADFSLWQDFIEDLQLQHCYSGNVLCNAARGGAIMFSPRRRGQAHHLVLPAAGLYWQLGIIDAPDLPSVDGWGRLALGEKEEKEIVWTDTPYIVTPYLKVWSYLGQYPRGRAGRTYLKEEVLELLADKVKYLALVEASVHGGDADTRFMLLAFGANVDTAALEACIEFELGHEFLPDRIEWLPLLPQRNEDGGADHDWCQFHYSTGELYRRQRSDIYRCLSELKQMILE